MSTPSAVRVGLNLSPSEDFREATLPLFEREEVDALEWNLDFGWGPPPAAWVVALLDAYSAAGRLYAHGVEWSPLSAGYGARQRAWLERAERDLRTRRFEHVSEHFGFMVAGATDEGTPLPVPACDAVIELGRERLAMLRAAAQIPVGLENLAFALGASDVDDQPAMLDAMLAPDAFLLLDVHNVWCQAVNFDRDAHALLRRYPLDRVRELHVAGGSWSTPASDPLGRRFRRDTHDDAIPPEVMALVRDALGLTPALRVVIVERTDGSIERPGAGERFRDDYRALRALVGEVRGLDA